MANALVVQRDLAWVPIKAGNTVSHSFDQRLIFDGTAFVSLHQADGYPFVGLIIEKMVPETVRGPRLTRTLAFACPTFGNSVYFELGGLAAEADGYPVLFTATRNKSAVSAESARKMHEQAWDLALVYVARGFDLRPRRPNPYDVIGSGALLAGYAPDEQFTADNYTWDPNTSDWHPPPPPPP